MFSPQPSTNLLFFCFAPLIYLHVCSRPKASQQTHNDLRLFVVRWGKKKAQAHISSSSFFFFFSLLLHVSPGYFSLFFILYLCFLFLSFYFKRWLHYLMIKCFLGTFTTLDWVMGHFLFFNFFGLLLNSCLDVSWLHSIG